MRILVAPDKFKLTLSAGQVAGIISSVLNGNGHEVIPCPLADGGEGTFELLTAACGGTTYRMMVSDPLGRRVAAEFGRSPDGISAYIDMSQAAGLFRLDANERDPERTTTFGVGEMIAEAIRLGAKNIIIGCGGSATNDGGAGMAAALGYRFMDVNGNAFVPTGGVLCRIARIDEANVNPSLKETRFTVISDVTNPFTGPEGASLVFAPQKGAHPDAILRLDEGLKYLASIFEKRTGFQIRSICGAGAGGGFTGGAAWFLGADSQPGADWVMHHTGFMEKLRLADLVITGEGRLDEQSLRGKVVSKVAGACRSLSIPCQVVCGESLLPEEAEVIPGVTRILSLTSLAGSPKAAIERSAFWLEKAAEALVWQLK